MNGAINYYNTRKKGYYRDQAIKLNIEMFEILTAEQICLLHFYNIKNWGQAMIKTRERLRQLKKLGGIKCEKIDVYGKPYGYFIDKRPRDRNIMHVVNRNWGIIYLIKLNSYFELDDVRFEYKFDDLVADGFVRLYSEKGGIYSYWFIESDMVDSRNKFTKVKQYNDMFEKDEWVKEYWVEGEFKPEYFPKIMVVSNDMRKVEKILDCVGKENKNGLEFYVISVDEIRGRLIRI